MGDICWEHKLGKEEQDSLCFSQRRRFSSSQWLIQAFLWACVFTIMILSSVHKHTSPKCFPSCGWDCFHLCFICSLLFFHSFPNTSTMLLYSATFPPPINPVIYLIPCTESLFNGITLLCLKLLVGNWTSDKPVEKHNFECPLFELQVEKQPQTMKLPLPCFTVVKNDWMNQSTTHPIVHCAPCRLICLKW